MTVQHCDFLVVGAGIAGVSVAWELAATGRTILAETERRAGCHATGRSVAILDRAYGNETIRALTAASHEFLQAPPLPIANPILAPRGVLYVADAARVDRLQAMYEAVVPLAPSAWLRDGEFARSEVAILRPEASVACLWDPAAADIDVAALLDGWLLGFLRRGGMFRQDAPVTRIEARGTGWYVEAGGRPYRAGVVINAAGAWADHVARLAGLAPLGLAPLRRTVAVVPVADEMDAHRWPLVVDVGEQWYFKGERGRLLVSPADESPAEPGDAQPDELDVATGIDRFESATTVTVRRVQSSWAGLRSFFADRTPVLGTDPRAPGFIWCAGQGGYGIQTAPAIAARVAAAARGEALPAVPEPAALAPSRFIGRTTNF